MRKANFGIKRALFGVAILSALCAATPASAIAIIDVVDPNPDILIAPGVSPSPCPTGFTCIANNLSFVHDITDDGFALVDIINSASVTIHLTDTGGNETYQYTIGLGQTETESNVATDTVDIYTLTVSSLADLQLDGMISITITHTGGNGNSDPTSFSFADSTLTAQVTKADPPTNGVPEPSTLLLFGAGLAGVGWRFGRRR